MYEVFPFTGLFDHVTSQRDRHVTIPAVPKQCISWTSQFDKSSALQLYSKYILSFHLCTLASGLLDRACNKHHRRICLSRCGPVRFGSCSILLLFDSDDIICIHLNSCWFSFFHFFCSNLFCYIRNIQLPGI